MVNLNEYTNCLISNNFTQAQLYFLLLINDRRYDLVRKYKKYIHKTTESNDEIIGDTWINDLIDRGFLVKTGEKLAEYEVTDKFLNSYMTIDKALDELIAEYPKVMRDSNRRQFPLIVGDRKDMKKAYFEAIRGDFKEHKQIIRDVKYGVNEGLITIRLSNFIELQKWIEIRAEREAENA